MTTAYHCYYPIPKFAIRAPVRPHLVVKTFRSSIGASTLPPVLGGRHFATSPLTALRELSVPKFSEWTEKDTDALTLGHSFKIKRFVRNPNPVTEGNLNQQLCHLQCAPIILLGAHRLFSQKFQHRLTFDNGHHFQRNQVSVYALGHMVFSKRYPLYTRRCYCFISSAPR
jgi:hypothetical protein